MKLEPYSQTLPQLRFDPNTCQSGLVLYGKPFGALSNACDHAPDIVLGHEVVAPLGGTCDRLPDFHGAMERLRYQRYLLRLTVAVLHSGRESVVLAMVGERGIVPGLEDDPYLLLEQFTVSVVVYKGCA